MDSCELRSINLVSISFSLQNEHIVILGSVDDNLILIQVTDVLHFGRANVLSISAGRISRN